MIISKNKAMKEMNEKSDKIIIADDSSSKFRS